MLTGKERGPYPTLRVPRLRPPPFTPELSMPLFDSNDSALIWRDYIVNGDPGSGAHPPVKSQVRAWAAIVEGVLEGTTAADALSVTGTLGVTGATTLAGLTAGNTQVNGTLGVTGAATHSGAVTANGGLTLASALTFSGTGPQLLSTQQALDLEKGVDVQAYSAELAALAALVSAADRGIYYTGAQAAALFTLTAAGRALLDDADAAAQRTTLGLGSAALRAAEDTLTSGSNLPDGEAVKGYVDGANSSRATTSGATQEFSGIPAGVTEIELILSGVSLSGSDNILIQLSTSSSYVVSGYTSTTTGFAGTALAHATSTAGIVVGVSAAGEAATGIATLRKVPGTNKWVASGSALRTTGARCTFDGEVTLGGAVDGVRLAATGSNNFDAGTLAISYKKRAA